MVLTAVLLTWLFWAGNIWYVLPVLVVTAALVMLLFLGVGLFIFLFAMFVALAGIFIMAPYFWPVLVIVLLVTILMVVTNGHED